MMETASDKRIINCVESCLKSHFSGNNFPKLLASKHVKFYLNGIRRGEQIAQKLIPFLKKKNVAVLDFGSGYGLVSLGLSKVFNGTIKGIDSDQKSINIAKKWLKISSIKHINFENIDIKHLKKFDVIVSTDVLEHVSDRLLYLKLLRNHLKKEGLLYIKTTNRLCIYNFLLDNHYWMPLVSVLNKNTRNKILSFMLKRDVDDVGDYSFKWELENLFKKSGFQTIKDFRPFNYFLMAHEYLLRKKD